MICTYLIFYLIDLIKFSYSCMKMSLSLQEVMKNSFCGVRKQLSHELDLKGIGLQGLKFW
jgi:hypothetical protein